MKTRSDDLNILISVVDCGSFTAAAEVLDVQVARVSRAVARLETQLNTTLLNRTTRRIELTVEGKAFINKVRQGLAIVNDAEEALLNDEQMPFGRLRVDAVTPFVLHQLVQHIPEFTAQYPDIELQINSNEGMVDLLEHRTDVAFRIGKLTDSSLHARFLGKSKLKVVASPHYLAQNGCPTTPEDLQKHKLLGFVNSKVLNTWALEGFSHFTPFIASTNGETIKHLTLKGCGISYLSEFMIKHEIKEGTLVPLLESYQLDDHHRENVHAMYYKTSSVSKRITAFLDFIAPRLNL